jgi:ribosomal protein L30
MADKSEQPRNPESEGRKLIRIEYYHSAKGFPEEQKEIVHALGLTKVGQVVQRKSTGEVLSMVAKVPHLLRIIE